MADKLLTLALVAGGGYLAYKFFFEPATSAAASTGTPSPGTPPAAPDASPLTPGTATFSPTAPVTTTSAPPNLDTLKGSLFAVIRQAGQGDILSSQQTPDTWNWWLMKVVQPFSPNWSAPGPETLFPSATDSHAAVDFNTWWAAVTPVLSSNLGLSGVYAGLGRIARGLRGVR